MTSKFDPELLYVECSQCGQPILWKRGMTTQLLKLANIDPSSLDERCVIMSDGCPACVPEMTTFTTQVIRLNREKSGQKSKSAMVN
ncbi:hypothetical protein [Pseudodesulfovibrio sp. S3]|uniref:hypothetical protein n=2 Tax=unclassified Pseudodesulfovibrio TaxID=2661612 RepID=UPI000FEBE521|nr:hypothetical protein [Pseudodesulfovibrio sp. S3]MCJ2165540.1 hypothetical protein [Pseudodesulfovibrio sp. S3-i]RWU03099.1 hypothetical protein DWB63_12905 [Pseudodesulfovibrio sp. S3]